MPQLEKWDGRELNSRHRRLGYFREVVEGLTMQEFADAVNAHLPSERRVSRGTVNNYEKQELPGPRIEFLLAMEKAFPGLRLDWLVHGDGPPVESLVDQTREEHLRARTLNDVAEGVEPEIPGWGPVATRVWKELFRRCLVACPEELSYAQQSALLSQLRRLVLHPLDSWNFCSRDDLSDDEFTEYVLAMVTALLKVVPAPGEGDRWEEREEE